MGLAVNPSRPLLRQARSFAWATNFASGIHVQGEYHRPYGAGCCVGTFRGYGNQRFTILVEPDPQVVARTVGGDFSFSF